MVIKNNKIMTVKISNSNVAANTVTVTSAEELEKFCAFTGKQNVFIHIDGQMVWSVEEFEIANDISDLF